MPQVERRRKLVVGYQSDKPIGYITKRELLTKVLFKREDIRYIAFNRDVKRVDRRKLRGRITSYRFVPLCGRLRGSSDRGRPLRASNPSFGSLRRSSASRIPVPADPLRHPSRIEPSGPSSKTFPIATKWNERL